MYCTAVVKPNSATAAEKIIPRVPHSPYKFGREPPYQPNIPRHPIPHPPLIATSLHNHPEQPLRSLSYHATNRHASNTSQLSVMEAARVGLKDVSEHLTKFSWTGRAQGPTEQQDGRSLGGGGFDTSLFRQQEVTSSEMTCSLKYSQNSLYLKRTGVMKSAPLVGNSRARIPAAPT